MRHKIAGNRLGRFTSWRKATIRDIAKATLIHQRICTTGPRAKEARKLVERLITLGKSDTLAARRKAFSILCDHQLVSSLFTRIAGRFKARVGGYTRIIPLSALRRGDNASLVYLELTEKEIIEPKKPQEKAAEKEKSKGAEVVHPAKTETAKTETKKEVPEAKKEPVRPKQPTLPPEKEKPGRDKLKPKPFMGGIKKIFNKKPSE